MEKLLEQRRREEEEQRQKEELERKKKEEQERKEKSKKRPREEPEEEDLPMCQYGEKCYRKNPLHFKQFRHPKKTKSMEKLK